MSYLKHKPGSIEELMANEATKLNDNAYQDMFKKELDKAGKGIGSMSPKEKKDFFNKIDSKYKAKDEGFASDAQRKAIYATKAEKGELKESPEQDEAVMDLRNLADEIEEKAEEAREIVRAVFPNELSRLDAYGAFNAMNSANRYDVTLGSFVDRLEEEGYEIEDGEVFTLEGDYKSDAQRKAVHASKAEKKEELKEGATCCGRCGRVHVKGSGCKRP